MKTVPLFSVIANVDRGEPELPSWLSPASAPVSDLFVVDTPPDLDHPTVRAELDAARAEIVGAARGELDREMGALRARFTDSLGRLERAARELDKKIASEVVDLALVVARGLIGRELARDREPLCRAIADSLAAVPDGSQVVVRIAREDAAYLSDEQNRSNQPRLLDEARVKIAIDDTLSCGGCVVETPNRVIDASIEARLAAVRDALIALLAAEEPC